MTSLLDVPPDVQGHQRPRFFSAPPSVSSAGAEAVELSRMAGLVLDPWQEFTLEASLGESADGKWAAFEVGLVVPRQNGKGGVLEARELAGLFLLGERFIVHSAHQFDTSLEAFRRLLFYIEDTPDFDRRVRRVSRSHGEEGVELKTGQRIRFRTRTSGGGRGFTGDCLILDEAMILPESAHGALLPTLSARPNPQVWYTGSAVDQEVHDHGVVFARIRERGLRGNDPSLVYAEWSVDTELPKITSEIAANPASWAQANPALGIRITPEYVEHERAALSTRSFAVERLGAGDWPRTDGGLAKVIPLEIWRACEDPESAEAEGSRVCFAFDVTPDQSVGTICLAGKRSDGLDHVEVVEQARGMAWIPRRMAELVKKWRPVAVVCDGSGPVGSLLPELAKLKVRVTPVTPKEHQQACGMFYTATGAADDPCTLRHMGQEELDDAVDGAARRSMGDAWLWDRKNSNVDISPLVGCTLALWGSRARKSAGFVSFRDL